MQNIKTWASKLDGLTIGIISIFGLLIVYNLYCLWGVTVASASDDGCNGGVTSLTAKYCYSSCNVPKTIKKKIYFETITECNERKSRYK